MKHTCLTCKFDCGLGGASDNPPNCDDWIENPAIKLRSEVRRLRGWIRHWSKRYDESSAGYIVCVPTCDDYDDALRGKPAPKAKP